jgi:prepilin-type N-terminal cleavage/methylation domain-containing protein
MRIKANSSSGFTLIEIMIVVAIIGLLAAIAIPNFAKMRQNAQKQACIMNLQTIDSAKEAWAAANRKANGDSVDEAAVNALIKKGAPECPAGGTYSYNAVGTPPSCSLGAATGHTL